MEHVPEPAAMSRPARDRRSSASPSSRFANGVEAWFKPTDFKNDQVLFSLAAPGGTSLAPPDKFLEAQLATGAGRAVGRRRPQRRRSPEAAGRQDCLGLAVHLARRSHGISGSSTPANLETALQLLNLEFTAPGDDAEAFALIKRQLEAAYANRERNPNARLRREGRRR